MLLSAVFCFCSEDALAKKKKKKRNKDRSSIKIEVLSNDGESTLYGSVLNPNFDDVNIKLNKKLLRKIKKAQKKNLSITVVSSLDATKKYTVPADAITTRRKNLGKTKGKFLVVNLFNLTTQSGTTISPSALPQGDYKLKVSSKEIDVTTEEFNYQTPALVVGQVDSSSSALVTVEDLSGDDISEKTVSSNANGTFFTEVRANRLVNSNTKTRRFIRAQVDGNGDTVVGEEEISTGVVHAVTPDKGDQLAIIPLSNDSDSNAAKASLPVEVSEASTLTANLAKKNEELAAEVANQQLEDLSNVDLSESTESSPSTSNDNVDDSKTCGILQFEHLCPDIGDSNFLDDLLLGGNTTSLSTFADIGSQLKSFLPTASCNFPEFNLLKTIVPSLPEDANAFIGIGYCEHAQREIDDDKPCFIYADILAQHKSEVKQGLVASNDKPCPPPFCDEFSHISPPECFEPIHFCEDDFHDDFNDFDDDFDDGVFFARKDDFEDEHCIHEPIFDPFCARIGEDIEAEQCNFGGRDPFWTIVTNSQGDTYCVPTDIPPPPPGAFFDASRPSSPEEVSEIECPAHLCHKRCEEDFGFTHGPEPFPDVISQPPSGGRIPVATSDAGSTVFQTSDDTFTPHPEPFVCEVCDCHFKCDIDAGFAVDCFAESDFFNVNSCEHPSCQPERDFSKEIDSFTKKGGRRPTQPIPKDIFGCLCSDPNNFESDGTPSFTARERCENTCPPGYESIPNSIDCFPACPEGTVRDHGGACVSNCPPGFIFDEFDNCSPVNCPTHCGVFRTKVRKLVHQQFGGLGTSTGFDSGFTPEPSGSLPSGLGLECSGCFDNECGVNQYFDFADNVCRCDSNGQVATSADACDDFNVDCGNTNMIPNPDFKRDPSQASCICPNGLPFWDDASRSCVAVCPDGSKPFENASTSSPVKSPIPCNNSHSTTCEHPYVKNPNGDPPCVCPDGTFELGAKCVGSCPAGTHASTSTSTGRTAKNVCLCDGSDSFPNAEGNCTNTTTGSITIKSATLSSDGTTLTVDFNKGFSHCARLEKHPSAIVLSSDFCNSGTKTIKVSTAQVKAGDNIKLCDLKSLGNCSNIVSISSTSTTNNCSSPFVPDSAFPNQCVCPSSTPIKNGNTCVVTCPSELTKTTIQGTSTTSTTLECRCSDGTAPNASGTCTSSSTGSSKITDATLSTDKTTLTVTYSEDYAGCARLEKHPSATVLSSSLCDSGTKTIAVSNVTVGDSIKLCDLAALGNCSDTFTVTGSSTTTNNCSSPFVPDSAFPNQCVCPSSTPIKNGSACVSTCPTELVKTTIQGTSTTSTTSECRCSDGTVPNNDGSCPVTCTSPKTLNTSTNKCECPSTQVDDGNGGCTCPTGQTLQNGTCVTQETITDPKAVISGGNITISYSTNVTDCLLAYATDNSRNYHNGVNGEAVLCNQVSSSSEIKSVSVTAGVGSFFLEPGTQFKLCTKDQKVCSAVTTTTTTDSLNLTSAKLTGGVLIVEYSKNFSDCVGLRTSDRSTRVTGSNQFCGNSGPATVDESALKTTLKNGDQVILCNDFSGSCSNVVSVTVAD